MCVGAFSPLLLGRLVGESSFGGEGRGWEGREWKGSNRKVEKRR
jgi:hypothetical protein